jgi:hypothetical protein
MAADTLVQRPQKIPSWRVGADAGMVRWREVVVDNIEPLASSRRRVSAARALPQSMIMRQT